MTAKWGSGNQRATDRDQWLSRSNLTPRCFVGGLGAQRLEVELFGLSLSLSGQGRLSWNRSVSEDEPWSYCVEADGALHAAPPRGCQEQDPPHFRRAVLFLRCFDCNIYFHKLFNSRSVVMFFCFLDFLFA